MPNIALMEQLRAQFRCVYVGADGMEKQIIAKHFGESCFYQIIAQKLQRKFTFKNLALPFTLAKSVKQCKKLLKELNPSAVFAKGGYVSFPVVYAAKKLKIPVLIHESDYTMGLANKISAKYCRKVFTTFSDTADAVGKKAVCSGSPIRQSIYSADRKKGLRTMGFDGKRKIVVITGGSLGAKRLNEITLAALQKLLETFDVFLIAGKGKTLNIKEKGFAQAEFADNIFDVFAAADVVVSRSGSNTVCELAAMRKPMLLVPLTQATRGEQTQNAKYFFKRGCCLTADEATLTPSAFCRKIRHAADNAAFLKQNLQSLNIDGTKLIVDEIKAVAEN